MTRRTRALRALLADLPLAMLDASHRLAALRDRLRLAGLDLPPAFAAARKVEGLRRRLAGATARLTEAIWHAEGDDADQPADRPTVLAFPAEAPRRRA